MLSLPKNTTLFPLSGASDFELFRPRFTEPPGYRPPIVDGNDASDPLKKFPWLGTPVTLPSSARLVSWYVSTMLLFLAVQ